jgi:biofilm PGA synthesis N-glycosyltransferase PgaC
VVSPVEASNGTGSADFYFPVRLKLAIALALSFAWVALSTWLAQPWISDLSVLFGAPLAWVMVSGIALLPGLASAFVLFSLVLDNRPTFVRRGALPPVTILIAAYNEEEAIRDTLESVVAQSYPGIVETIVCDDGSTDRTVAIVEEFIASRPPDPVHRVRLMRSPKNGGKAAALNLGLDLASHDFIITVDGDTLLFADALANIVTNLVDGPPKTAAVAGSVLVRNSRRNFLTRLQEWDYFHGIAIVKRTQSLYQGTLVAQGAFSVYRREVLKELGGWHPTVGEDIVLTWAMLEAGYRVGYAENAFVFTNVPESYGAYYRQRKRWARGMIEAFKKYPDILVRPKMNLPFIYFNLTFPYIDFMYLFVFVPGMIGALLFQWYALVGIMTLILLPLAFICNVVMFHRQRGIFKKYGLKVRRNLGGLLVYVLVYQLFLTPPSLAGYATEFLGWKKTW